MTVVVNSDNWQDYVIKVAHLQEENKSHRKVAFILNVSERHVGRCLKVFSNLNSGLIKDAETVEEAFRILTASEEKLAREAKEKIETAGASMFDLKIERDETPVKLGTFETWIKTYEGPKFNVIHCDPSRGVTNELVIENLDKFCSHNAHLILWFSMDSFTRTKQALKELRIIPYPLVWFRSDNSGSSPNPSMYPREVYETAFLCVRGARDLIKPLSNLYACPPLIVGQKPQPMLRHFLSMIVDKATDVFDPLAGTGAALKAAEDVGARSILGLDPDYENIRMANKLIAEGRKMRGLKT